MRTGPSYHPLVFTHPGFSRLRLSPRQLGHLVPLLRVLRAWPWHPRPGAEGSGKGWPQWEQLYLPARRSSFPGVAPAASRQCVVSTVPSFPTSPPLLRPAVTQPLQMLPRHWVPKGGMSRMPRCLPKPRGFFVFLSNRSV